METFLIGAASNTLSSFVTAAIPPLLLFIDDVINFDQNTQLLQDKLTGLKALLQDVTNQFQHDQRSPPETVVYWLQKLQQSLREARSLIDRSQQQKQCLDCLFRKRRLSTQIREWRTNFDELFREFQNAFSVLHNAQQIALPTQQRAEALLKPVPEGGFEGLGIRDAEKKVQTWLSREDRQSRVIVIFGMGGIGKTSLLKTVYNAYKQGNVFQYVIWFTVSQNIDILSIQSVIADSIRIDLGSSSNAESSIAEMRKMKLFTHLKEKKFLLVLDDLWSPLDQYVIWFTVSQNIDILSIQSVIADSIRIDLGSSSNAESSIAEMRKMKLFTHLKEKKFLLVLDDLWSPGVPVDNKKGSKVIISTRNRDVISEMGTNVYSIKIEPLSEEEGWHLFCREAFNNGSAPSKSIEDLGRLIAGECKGLPLAIKFVAAAVKDNATADKWSLALAELKNVDPHFLNDTGIDKGLYQKLKWSYNLLLNSNLQKCFLYCGAFREDEQINVECLVEMWIAEGLVDTTETSYLLDRGHRYVKILVARCLFEDIYGMIKVHDVVRDMEIHIAEEEENCLFRTNINLQNFSDKRGIDSLKRIAIHSHNDIPFLPTDLTCPNLLALLLGHNQSLREVPNGFFLNVTTFRVLDMSHTNIESLPVSMWHLNQEIA